MRRVTCNDFEQSDYAVDPYLSMQSDGEGSRSGTFASRQGLVRVFDSKLARRSTFILFIHDGRSYNRNWATTWGDRTLARLARELIEDVLAGRWGQ